MHRLDSRHVRIPDSECPFEAWRMDGEGSESVDEEWVRFRDTGIGGSDVAAIMGISKYRSPVEVWGEKTGRIPRPDLSEKEAVEWGNRLEDVIRRKFREAHPELKVMAFNATLVSKERPWAHANLDGRLRDESGRWGILEIKTVGNGRAHDWDDGVPDYYLAQVTHYMAVTGWTYAYVAALIGGNHYVEFRVERDEGDVAMVSKAVDDFWHNYVETGATPMLVGIESEAKAMYQLHPEGDGAAVVSDPKARELLNDMASEYERLRKAEAEAKSEKNAVAAQMRMVVGDNKTVSSDVYAVTWIRRSKHKFDLRRFREENPDTYEAYCEDVSEDGGIRVRELR